MEELIQIRERYQRRETSPRRGRYSYFNPDILFMVQVRQRKLLELLKRHGFEHLKDKYILEIGCGGGGWLRDFVQWGADPDRLYGIDLLENRIRVAQRLSPNFHYAVENAEHLGFGDQFFDLVLLATCLTSVLDTAVRSHIAQESLRVLRHGGIVVWYDFRCNNPSNPDVKGIGRKEIRNLFGNLQYDFSLVTLAPPIARVVAPVSWLACELLAKLHFLKTHYLVIIKKTSARC